MQLIFFSLCAPAGRGSKGVAMALARATFGFAVIMSLMATLEYIARLFV